MGKFQKSKENGDKRPKKQTGKYLQWGICVAVVLLLAVLPMLASRSDGSQESQASILSATMELQDIDTQIIGGGQLSSEASLNIRVPENVKLTQYLVGNGDAVQEGDAIATVDKVSVMTAITEVQETLDYLTEKIADASDDTASTSVKALTGGTVKVIYAQEGESVQDAMLDHGALAVLSLDDVMAVQISRETTLDVGDTVCVELDDGTEVEGRVQSNLEGVLTITMEDDDYAVGEKVTVFTEDGDRLGSGELYIFSPWSATAYSGTVSDILVKENATVYVGQALFTLEDTGHTAQFQRLIDQRQEYEELMQELFTMYRTQTLTAPCAGIVTGVDEDGAYLLADDNKGWFVSLLSFLKKEDTGFAACAVQVTDVTEEGMTLNMAPSMESVWDLSEVSGIGADLSAMTEVWHYTGEPVVYTQDADGLLYSAGTARKGDVLAAVGDADQVYWFVLLSGKNDTVQTESTSGPLQAQLLSDTVFLTGDDGSEEQDTCTGEADCTYAPHNASCKSLCDLSENCTAINHKDGCESQKETEQATVSILTSSLNSGVVGQSYTAALQATDGTAVVSGTWAASGLPTGLTLDVSTGLISGTPTTAGSYTVTISFTYETVPVVKEFTLTITEASAETKTYLGYVAQVTEITDGSLKVNQTPYAYTITDLDNLPTVSIDTNALTEEATYVSSLITESSAAVDDYLLIIVEQDGTLKQLVQQEAPSSEEQTGTAAGTQSGAAGGGTPSGGAGAGGGASQIQTFTLYSLEKLTVASVTSQEHMQVSITIDELDITRIYVGQSAVVSVDALGGEQFEAQITGISNSGENDGGNSKFTVEVTLGKLGEMLPGMYSSVFITLETREDVPCVPVAALDTDGTDSILYTSYDAKSGTLGDPVVVTIGASDGENVEILDGFAAGQTCYYEYYDTYTGSDTPDRRSGGFNLGRMLGRR